MRATGKYLSLLVGAGFAALLYDPSPALAVAVAPNLASATNYTVLATNPVPTSGTVTCTNATINGGRVGTTFNTITNTGCTITGPIDAPVPGGVVTDFNTAYTNLDSQNPTCDTVQTGTLAGITLPPGVHCFAAGAALTGVLTLDGPSTGIWVFKIGTGGTGSLAGTSFQMVMAGGGQACNVYWRTAQAATMTDSNFLGTILSGTAVTLTRGTYVGRAMAKTDVTVTGVVPMTFGGCAAATTTLSTQVASPGVTLGAAISDTATLSGGAAPTGTITFNLYGPNDATCTGASIFTSPVPVNLGNATYASGSFIPTTAGTYRWIANYSGDTNNAATANACNAPNEIVVVAAVAIPTLTTQASPAVTLGAAISDTATLSGGAAPTGTITFRLYGPNDATCTTPAIFTSVVAVNLGNNTYLSGSFTPTVAGTYRWIATYSGDANNAGVATACNIFNENVIVAPPAAAIPTLTTQVSSAAVTLGAALSDTATLSGGAAPTGTITFRLFGPNDTTCVNAAIFTATVSVNLGNATYASGSFTPTVAGTYRWIANYSGDANNAATVNACNALNENVVVAPPAAAITTLTTQASPTVGLGQAISDTATLSGGAAPTGTITFRVYGPIDPTCTDAPIFTATVPVIGNGTYASGSFTPTVAGTYRWIANYSGDANNAPTANACNAPNENVVVAPVTVAPSVPTLSEWGMILMVAFLVLFGLAGIRRRAV